MANNRFNKQVTPKGYKRGGGVTESQKKQAAKAKPKIKATTKKFLKTIGSLAVPAFGAAMTGKKVIDKLRAKKMGGGMMMKRPMMKDGGNMKNLPKGLRKDTTTSAYGDAGKGRPVPLFLKTRPGQNPKGKNVPISERAPKLKAKKRKKMMGGGSLKPVDPQTQKGLSKLPTKVRNKMGYMKKGGKLNGI